MSRVVEKTVLTAIIGVGVCAVLWAIGLLNASSLGSAILIGLKFGAPLGALIGIVIGLGNWISSLSSQRNAGHRQSTLEPQNKWKTFISCGTPLNVMIVVGTITAIRNKELTIPKLPTDTPWNSFLSNSFLITLVIIYILFLLRRDQTTMTRWGLNLIGLMWILFGWFHIGVLLETNFGWSVVPALTLPQMQNFTDSILEHPQGWIGGILALGFGVIVAAFGNSLNKIGRGQ